MASQGAMDAKLTKIFFELDPKAWHGSGAESMWAEDLGRGRYRLRNSPFHAYDVSFGDVVRGEPSEGVIWFKGVLERSGNSTFRIRLQRGLTHESPDFVEAWSPFKALGCGYEGGNFGRAQIFAINVPDSADIETIWHLLMEGENRGLWEVEVVQCDHWLD